MYELLSELKLLMFSRKLLVVEEKGCIYMLIRLLSSLCILIALDCSSSGFIGSLWRSASALIKGGCW